MHCAVDETQRDPPVGLVREKPPLLRRDEAELIGLALVGHEHVAERHLIRRDLVNVDDEAAEGVVEDALLDPHRGLRPQDVEHQRLERVVRARQRLDHQDGGDGRRPETEHEHRPQEPQRAHAAGLERDDLHVRREAAEGHEDRQEEADRDRQDQERRQDVGQQQQDQGHRDTLVDDQVGQVEDLVDQQEEGEHEQADTERGDELFPDVAVENVHAGPLAPFYGTPRTV